MNDSRNSTLTTARIGTGWMSVSTAGSEPLPAENGLMNEGGSNPKE